MEAHIEQLLDQLATTEATIALRSDDLIKLYSVCLHSHAHGGVPDLHTIKTYLANKGCPKPTADFLGCQFERLAAILKRHDDGTRKGAGLSG